MEFNGSFFSFIRIAILGIELNFIMSVNMRFLCSLDFIVNRKALLLILAALLVESRIESRMGSLNLMEKNTLCLLTNLQTVSMVRNYSFLMDLPCCIAILRCFELQKILNATLYFTQIMT